MSNFNKFVLVKNNATRFMAIDNRANYVHVTAGEELYLCLHHAIDFPVSNIEVLDSKPIDIHFLTLGEDGKYYLKNSPTIEPKIEVIEKEKETENNKIKPPSNKAK